MMNLSTVHMYMYSCSCLTDITMVDSLAAELHVGNFPLSVDYFKNLDTYTCMKHPTQIVEYTVYVFIHSSLLVTCTLLHVHYTFTVAKYTFPHVWKPHMKCMLWNSRSGYMYCCCVFFSVWMAQDSSRLHYEPSELKVFENIECEWPVFLALLLIDSKIKGDQAYVRHTHTYTHTSSSLPLSV